MKSEFVTVPWRGATVQIEHAWIGDRDGAAPLLIFLHEGLGSLAMWKDFPAQLCAAARCSGLVYSRPGYGRSSALEPEEAWDLDFMHRQAHELLPALLQALAIEGQRPWLFGHSDGASIALLYAARYPDRVSGAIVLAPHINVEDVAVTRIGAARTAYRETDLKQRLAKYHDDPDRAFSRWNRIWLHPPFKAWSIEHEISTIRCPLLAVQGVDDEYGTLAQIHGIARRLPQTELLQLADCRHSPHRDQPEALIEASTAFLRRQFAKAAAAQAGDRQ